MKRLSIAVVALLALIPLQGAIAGSESTSGADLAFFDPSTATWDFGENVFYGAPGDAPLLCDWDGDGVATVGVYRDWSGYLLLQNENDSGPAQFEFYYGIPGDRPVCGDWDGDGIDSIGIFRSSESKFYLRNANDQGFADIEFSFGFERGIPFAGDWDGDGVDTVGLRDPKNGFVAVARGHSSEAQVETYYGISSDAFLVGDWDGDGTDRFGVYRQETRMLAVTDGFADPIATGFFDVAPQQGIPLAAEWKSTSGITKEAPTWEPPPEPPPASQPQATPEPQPERVVQNGDSPATDAGAAVPSSAPPAKNVAPAIPVPADAVRIAPGTSIQDVVNAHGEGATFLLEAGVHRLQQVKPKNGQAFIGAPGAIMSGARVLTDWQRDGNTWSVGGQSQEGRVHGDCESGFSRCNRPEELFIDNVRMRHVGSRDAVGPGTWHFDYGADRIHIGDDPGGKLVETSVTEKAFYGQVSGVTVTGLVIEKYANPAQLGAIDTRENPSGSSNGSDWFIANNEVRNNHGVGIKSTDRARVTGNYVHHNGQLGLGGDGPGMLIENNEIAYNNAAGYAYGWEGGGTKWAFTQDLVVRNNYSHHNVGPGLWTDIDNIRTLYEGNRVVGNDHIGIFHEISYDAVIRNNYIEGNGFGHSAWLWGGGIVVAASPNVEVYGNEVINNADGIAGIQQNRSDAPSGYGPQEISNLYVHDNVIVMGEGHTGFVQDIGDNSYFTSRNNRFENNTYTLNGDGKQFAWDNGSKTLEEWLAAGQS